MSDNEGTQFRRNTAESAERKERHLLRSSHLPLRLEFQVSSSPPLSTKEENLRPERQSQQNRRTEWRRWEASLMRDLDLWKGHGRLWKIDLSEERNWFWKKLQYMSSWTLAEKRVTTSKGVYITGEFILGFVGRFSEDAIQQSILRDARKSTLNLLWRDPVQQLSGVPDSNAGLSVIH